MDGTETETPAPRVFVLNEYAVVAEAAEPVTLACQQRIWSLAADLALHPAVCEVIPGMNNLTAVVDPDVMDPEAFCPVLQDRWLSATSASSLSQRVIEIPVTYGGVDGPDLVVVARHCGLTFAEVVTRHSADDYVVYFIGFQPGFAYLGGLDPCLATPRRAEPRTLVPAGSIGIGGIQTGVYPAATPGGWQIIGRTAITLFDPERQPPALLQAGDRVRFIPVNPISND